MNNCPSCRTHGDRNPSGKKPNEVHATLTSYTGLETNQNYNSYKE